MLGFGLGCYGTGLYEFVLFLIDGLSTSDDLVSNCCLGVVWVGGMVLVSGFGRAVSAWL